MYNEQIEALISAALTDGILTEKEKQILFKKAQAMGIDLDEFEMVLDARLIETQRAEQEKRENSSPKSDKYGDVRKCPACGAIVGAFKGNCPECGYEFSNVDANLSSKKLYESISKVESNTQKIELIETFPIPNTKADLLEFLTALKPRITDPNSKFSNSYYKKYAECIEKAKVSFIGDKQLQPFVDEFTQFKKDLKKKQVINSLKKKWALFTVIAVALFVILSPIFIEEIVHNKLQKKIAIFNKYISRGDSDKAKSILEEMNIDYFSLQDWDIYCDGALDLIKLYITKEDIDNAIYVYEKITPIHCSMHEIDWSSYNHGTQNNYEVEATKLIRNGLIKMGKYDLAWEYSPLDYETRTYTGNAQSYYQFMSDVVMNLCQTNKKEEAHKFVKDYIVWFSNNVDPKRGIQDWKHEYKNYNSTAVKTKLSQIINNY